MLARFARLLVPIALLGFLLAAAPAASAATTWTSLSAPWYGPTVIGNTDDAPSYRLHTGASVAVVGNYAYTVEARWTEVIPYLNGRGYSVTVMQSNNDFSVGGSLSVNCHGWQANRPPIASSVEALRVMRPSGEVVRCSRAENTELFSLVLGYSRLLARRRRFGCVYDESDPCRWPHHRPRTAGRHRFCYEK